MGQRPAEDAGYLVQLILSPQGDRHAGLLEGPTDGQLGDGASPFRRHFFQFLRCGEVLAEPLPLKHRVIAAAIVFGKGGIGGKFSGEQPAGQGSPGERSDAMPAALTERRFEKMLLEQMELQLVCVEGGDLSPRLHLFRTEIADADGPDHALFRTGEAAFPPSLRPAFPGQANGSDKDRSSRSAGGAGFA